MDEHALTFHHEGVLFRRSFCMYDAETGSIWVHATGECVKGPLKGRLLDVLPSTVTTWGRWKLMQPATTAMVGERHALRGVFGLRDDPGSFGLGLLAPGALGAEGADGKAKLYPYEVLLERGVINDRFRGRPVAIVFDPDLGTALAWDAEIDGVPFPFYPVLDRKPGEPLLMRDGETLGTWIAAEGRCVEGPREGAQLRRLIATTWHLDDWPSFYPRSETYREPDDRSGR